MVAFAVPVSAAFLPFVSNLLLKVLVPIYILLLLSMLWRALSRLQIFNREVEWTWTKLCCSLGALCFVISDSVLSFDLFIYDVPYSHPIIMLTYYAAQLGIALSVVDSSDPKNKDVNHLVIQHSDLIKGIRTIYKQVKGSIFDENLEFVHSSKTTETRPHAD
jgi:hypothetical protein